MYYPRIEVKVPVNQYNYKNLLVPHEKNTLRNMIDGSKTDGILPILRNQDQMAICTYGDNFEFVSQAFYNQVTKDKLLKFSGSIALKEKSTPKLFDALVDSLDVFKKTDLKRKVVILISDGIDNISEVNRADDVVEKYSQKDVPIYSLCYNLLGYRDYRQLNNLSSKTVGSVVESSSFQALPVEYQKLTQITRKSIILKFRASGMSGDNAYHRLIIGLGPVNTPAFIAQDSKKFYATKTLFIKYVPYIIVILILIIVLYILIVIIQHRRLRKLIGISNRKCPDCHRIMRDDWDECVFCKYVPSKKLKKRKEKEKEVKEKKENAQ